ncbi:MAG TPA: hypothetical protein VF432_10180 [Thermoanaerobaculia bacterium]
MQTTDELVIYLDASKSIQGYVQHDGRTIYGKTLRELRNFSSLLSRPLRVSVRRVDGEVGDKVPNVELNRASMSRAIYTGAETNLAGAFAQFGPAVAAAGSIPVKTPVPLLQVVVTDGVQSIGAEASQENCAAGTDQVCVRAQMLRWINSGWSAVILGVRSEFNGVIYSEINRLSPGQPYAVPYSTSTSDRQSYRPFYLYAFSPDQSALTGFVATLKRRLRLTDEHVVMRELPINVDYTSGRMMAHVTSRSDATQLISVEGGKKVPTDRLTVRVDARAQPTADAVLLRVSIPWSPDAADMGTKEELARNLTWDVVPLLRNGRGRRPEITIGETTVNKDGTINVPLTPHWPSGTGELSWNVLAIRAKLNFDEDAPQWVRDWSTDLDTSASYGNRTLFLESAVLGLWRSSKLQSRIVSEIYVRVGP